MRLPKGSPDPPLYMLIRVFLKGLVSYHESREKVKEDFLEIFPVMAVYDPPKDLWDEEARTDSDLKLRELKITYGEKIIKIWEMKKSVLLPEYANEQTIEHKYANKQTIGVFLVSQRKHSVGFLDVEEAP